MAERGESMKIVFKDYEYFSRIICEIGTTCYLTYNQVKFLRERHADHMINSYLTIRNSGFVAVIGEHERAFNQFYDALKYIIKEVNYEKRTTPRELPQVT
jgi:hypothetical protein